MPEYEKKCDCCFQPIRHPDLYYRQEFNGGMGMTHWGDFYYCQTCMKNKPHETDSLGFHDFELDPYPACQSCYLEDRDELFVSAYYFENNDANPIFFCRSCLQEYKDEE